MNMAKYGSWRLQQPANVNFEPIIRGLKSDIFPFIYVRFNCKEKKDKKMSGNQCHWGGGTLFAALPEWYQTAQTPEMLARGSRPGRQGTQPRSSSCGSMCTWLGVNADFVREVLIESDFFKIIFAIQGRGVAIKFFFHLFCLKTIQNHSLKGWSDKNAILNFFSRHDLTALHTKFQTPSSRFLQVTLQIYDKICETKYSF